MVVYLQSSCFLFSILSYFLLFFPPPFTIHGYPILYHLQLWDLPLLSPQPFLASCGHLSKIAHSLACYLAITFAQSVLVAPFSIFRKNYLSCFLPLFFFVSPQWIRIKLPQNLPLWYASSGPNLHLPLLGEMPSQQDLSPKKLGR